MGEEMDLGISNVVRIWRPLGTGENGERESSEIIHNEATRKDNPTEVSKSQISNGQNKRIRRSPVRSTYNDLLNKKEVLESLRDTVNVVKADKYKYVFFQQDLTWRQRAAVKARRAAMSNAKGAEIELRACRAHQSSGERIFQRN